MTPDEVEEGSGYESTESYALEHTPTWAVGAVCIVFIAVSLLMQRGLSYLGAWLVKKHKKSLNEALEKMKEELMLLGFISLLLTAAQNPISRVCMPDSWSDHMLPCQFNGKTDSPYHRYPPEYGAAAAAGSPSGYFSSNQPHDLQASHRSLLVVDSPYTWSPFSSTPHKVLPLSGEGNELVGARARRSVMSGLSNNHFCSEGHVPVLSTESLHQLHIFIFVMALVHVLYSCSTMLFGFTQLRSWKKWEEETCVDNYNYSDEVKKSFSESTFRKITLGRQSTFVTSRTNNPWSTTFTGIWVNSFFRQFGRSVTRSDYLSLRLGFIQNHNAPLKLNFHKYMMRSLEDDLKTVIGISGYLWVFVIVFMILNVHGWYAYFWMSFIPVFINMVIGTKLQHIITQLAMETVHSHGFIGAPIKPRDELFWFNNPHLLLYLIHFVLFQNAFELAFCIWLVTTFGFNSCFFNKHGFIITRVIVGVLAQVLCSYSTLPLYALVSQMGSHYKRAIFDQPVSNAIQGWRSKAKETRRKMRHQSTRKSRASVEILRLHLHHESGSSRHRRCSSATCESDPDSSLCTSCPSLQTDPRHSPHAHEHEPEQQPQRRHEDEEDEEEEEEEEEISVHTFMDDEATSHAHTFIIHHDPPKTPKTPRFPKTPGKNPKAAKSVDQVFVEAVAALKLQQHEQEDLKDSAAVKKEEDREEEPLPVSVSVSVSAQPVAPSGTLGTPVLQRLMCRTLSFKRPALGGGGRELERVDRDPSAGAGPTAASIDRLHRLPSSRSIRAPAPAPDHDSAGSASASDSNSDSNAVGLRVPSPDKPISYVGGSSHGGAMRRQLTLLVPANDGEEDVDVERGGEEGRHGLNGCE